MKLTQTQAIQKHLEDGNSITALEALNLFGCFRLAARISDIKSLGLKIVTNTVKANGKSFASYQVA